MKVELKLVDEFAWDISQCEGCNVVEIASGIIWLQRVHLDLVGVNSQSIGNT